MFATCIFSGIVKELFVGGAWLLDCKHSGREVFGWNYPAMFMATLLLITVNSVPPA